MNVRKNILLIGLSFHLLWLHAHSTSEATDICCQDSAVHTDISETRIHIRPRENFKREFSYMGIPLIASGLIVKKKNEDFRTLQNRFEPTFHRRYDDYTQYVPLVAAWGLKLAGVESRSSWKELAVSNAFSAILMAGVVNSLNIPRMNSVRTTPRTIHSHRGIRLPPLCAQPSSTKNTG